jgi:F0F1-type ATP synthase assembly protein I
VIRLLAAAAGFAGTVIGGFVIGIVLTRVTGAAWWTLVGLLVGLAFGIAVIARALRRLVVGEP